MLSTCMKYTPGGMQNKNIFLGKVDKFEVRIIQTIKKALQKSRLPNNDSYLCRTRSNAVTISFMVKSIVN